MFDQEVIKAHIPHRDPFLFVEEIEYADNKIIKGSITFTKEKHEFFKGHFPSYPIVPGVLLVEAMAQCGGAGIKIAKTLPSNAIFFLASIEKAKFRNPVTPNDKIHFEIINEMVTPKMIKQSGKAYLGEVLASEASWLCVLGQE